MLRAYKADGTHFSDWCAAKGFVPVPAAPEAAGAYLASLAETHALATIRRRLLRVLKNAPIQRSAVERRPRIVPFRGRRRACWCQHGLPQKAAASSLAMLRQLLATCDRTARVRRDRALLLFAFTGALRRSELVSLRVEDVVVDGNGLRLRILRGKTDQEGQGAEIGLPRGRHAETCPLRAFEDWQAVAQRKAGPLFRKVTASGRVGGTALHPDAVRRILPIALGVAGMTPDGFDRLSAPRAAGGLHHRGVCHVRRDEDIMRHTRHRDLRTMRGYVRRAGLVTGKPGRDARSLTLLFAPPGTMESDPATVAPPSDSVALPPKRRGRRSTGPASTSTRSGTGPALAPFDDQRADSGCRDIRRGRARDPGVIPAVTSITVRWKTTFFIARVGPPPPPPPPPGGTALSIEGWRFSRGSFASAIESRDGVPGTL